MDAVTKTVADRWIPIDPQTLAKVQRGLKAGAYRRERETLILDLKEDLALFLFCVRELATSKSEVELKVTGPLEPMALIRSATDDELEEIIKRSEELANFHKLENATSEQASRLRESIVATQSSEILAGNHACDPELVFAVSTFRQLGLILIAWNYPHIYSRTLASLRSHQTLEGELGRKLGFSPLMLGVSLAREWRIAPMVRRCMGDEKAVIDDDNPAVLALVATVKKICQVGEALARLDRKQDYPEPKAGWDSVQSTLLAEFKPNQIFSLLDSIDRSCARYAKALPNILLVSEESLSSSISRRAITSDFNADSNSYLKHLPEPQQIELKELYKQRSSGAVNREDLDKIVRNIIPALGYHRGCIYLVEVDTLSLVPRLAIGFARINEFQPVQYLSSDHQTHPVSLAYKSTNVISGNLPALSPEAAQLSYVAATLGEIQKAGVLYLEHPSNKAGITNSKELAIFRAIVQALNDFLNLQ